MTKRHGSFFLAQVVVAAMALGFTACSTPNAKRSLASGLAGDTAREVRKITSTIDLPEIDPKVFGVGTSFTIKPWDWSASSVYVTSIGIGAESQKYFDCPTVRPRQNGTARFVEDLKLNCTVRKLGAKQITLVYEVEAQYPEGYRYDGTENEKIFSTRDILANYPENPISAYDFERLFMMKAAPVVSTEMSLSEVIDGKERPLAILPVSKKGDVVRIKGASGRVELRRKAGKVFADVNKSDDYDWDADLKMAAGKTRRSILKIMSFLRPMKNEAPYSVVCKFSPTKTADSAHKGEKQVIYRSAKQVPGYFVLPEDGQVVCQGNYRTTGPLAVRSGFFNVEFYFAKAEMLAAAKSENTATLAALIKGVNEKHFRELTENIDSPAVKEYIQKDLIKRFKDRFSARSQSMQNAAERAFQENVIVRMPHTVEFQPWIAPITRISEETGEHTRRDYYSLDYAVGKLGGLRGYFTTGNSSDHRIEMSNDLVALRDYTSLLTGDQAQGQGIDLFYKLGSLEVNSSVSVRTSGLPGETVFRVCLDEVPVLQKRLEEARTRVDHDLKSLDAITEGLAMTEDSRLQACLGRIKERSSPILVNVELSPVVQYRIGASATESGDLKLSPAGASLVFSNDLLLSVKAGQPAARVTYPLSALSRDFGPWFETEAVLGKARLESHPASEYMDVFGGQTKETFSCKHVYGSINDQLDANLFIGSYYQKPLLEWLKEGMPCYDF